MSLRDKYYNEIVRACRDEEFNKRFLPSPYISKEEESFLEFCKNNSLEVKIQESNETERIYSVVMKPEYLDNVEKKVVEHCRKHGIQYTFYRDQDGNHHYNFSKLVDFSENEGDPTGMHTKLNLVSYDEILAKHKSKDQEPIKKIPKHWWEKLLAKFGFIRIKKPKPKSDYDYFLESLGVNKSFTVEDLKKLALPEEEIKRKWRL